MIVHSLCALTPWAISLVFIHNTVDSFSNFVYICVNIYVKVSHVCIKECVTVYVHMWRPEVDVRSLPMLFSILGQCLSRNLLLTG